MSQQQAKSKGGVEEGWKTQLSKDVVSAGGELWCMRLFQTNFSSVLASDNHEESGTKTSHVRWLSVFWERTLSRQCSCSLLLPELLTLPLDAHEQTPLVGKEELHRKQLGSLFSFFSFLERCQSCNDPCT